MPAISSDLQLPKRYRDFYWRLTRACLKNIFCMSPDAAVTFRACLRKRPSLERLLVYHDTPLRTAQLLCARKEVTEQDILAYENLRNEETERCLTLYVKKYGPLRPDALCENVFGKGYDCKLLGEYLKDLLNKGVLTVTKDWKVALNRSTGKGVAMSLRACDSIALRFAKKEDFRKALYILNLIRRKAEEDIHFNLPGRNTIILPKKYSTEFMGLNPQEERIAHVSELPSDEVSRLRKKHISLKETKVEH